MNTRIIQILLVTFVLGPVWAPPPASAQNLLTNGDLEAVAGISGWTVEETVTGMPGAAVSAVEVNRTFMGILDALEVGNPAMLWLKGFAGNTGAYDMDNVAVNADLSQLVPATPGETYTLVGHSRMEEFFSGGNAFMDPDSPSGNIMSPTESKFELAFLDSSGQVIGVPETIDLRTVHPDPPDDTWRQSMLMGTAPTGAVNVRVRAYSNDMLFNLAMTEQSAFYDNFSLTAQSDQSGTNLLTNGGFDAPAPPEFEGWEVTQETDNLANTGAFSNNPNTGGKVGGFWKAFNGGDAFISQTVDGVPGGEYTFSAWSAWGHTFTGGIEPTDTETFMELAFLNDQGGEIGDPLQIDLLEEGQMNATDPGSIADQPEAWRQFSVSGTAPTGTVSVRVTAGILGMMANPMGGEQSAFFDDFALTLASATVPGDYNEDGMVDAADYTIWRDNLGASITLPNEGVTPGMVTSEDYDFWVSNFGSGAGSGNLLVAGAVPEPGTCLLMLTLCGGAAAVASRRRPRQRMFSQEPSRWE